MPNSTLYIGTNKKNQPNSQFKTQVFQVCIIVLKVALNIWAF